MAHSLLGCLLVVSRRLAGEQQSISRDYYYLFFLLVSAPFLYCRNQPPTGDPQAVTYASRAIAALTGGTSISDVTLTGRVTWNGSGADTGSATLKAFGTDESRVDLALSSGTRTEVRDAQMGAPRGQWKSEDKKTRTMPEFNCLTDAAWFFPALTSLGGRRDRLLKYLGQETRNNATVEHLRSYVRDPKWPKAVAPTLERRRSMDFYLDAATLLPVAVSFNVHPDNDGNADLLTEVEFSDYQNLNGVLVPMRIRKYVQGSLLLDIAVSNVALNTRLGLAEFAVNPERAGR